MANQAKKIYGSVVNHIVAETTDLSNEEFSLQSHIDNVVDNTTDLYPFAEALLFIDDWASAPVAGRTVALYRRVINIFGTAANDEPIPDLNYKELLVGVFRTDAVDADQYLFIDEIPLTGYEHEFYIQNQAGATIEASTTPWDLDIRPYTWGPT